MKKITVKKISTTGIDYESFIPRLCFRTYLKNPNDIIGKGDYLELLEDGNVHTTNNEKEVEKAKHSNFNSNTIIGIASRNSGEGEEIVFVAGEENIGENIDSKTFKIDKIIIGRGEVFFIQETDEIVRYKG